MGIKIKRKKRKEIICWQILVFHGFKDKSKIGKYKTKKFVISKLENFIGIKCLKRRTKQKIPGKFRFSTVLGKTIIL